MGRESEGPGSGGPQRWHQRPSATKDSLGFLKKFYISTLSRERWTEMREEEGKGE